MIRNSMHFLIRGWPYSCFSTRTCLLRPLALVDSLLMILYELRNPRVYPISHPFLFEEGHTSISHDFNAKDGAKAIIIPWTPRFEQNFLFRERWVCESILQPSHIPAHSMQNVLTSPSSVLIPRARSCSPESVIPFFSSIFPPIR